MRFDLDHAEDVALSSSCVLASELFPHATGLARERLIRRLTEFLMTTLLAFCELHPPTAVPEPSRN